MTGTSPSTDIQLIDWLIRTGADYLRTGHSMHPGAGLSVEQRVILEQQLGFRKRASGRFPNPEDWLWTDRSLAQASDWWSASYKAGWFPTGEPVIDACCGAGVDAVALAQRGPVTALDDDPAMCLLTKANAQTHALRLTTRCLSFEALLDAGDNASPLDMPVSQQWLHVDPDRRVGANKTRRADRLMPAIDSILTAAQRFRGTLVKLPPSTIFDPDAEARIERESTRGWLGNHWECRQQVLLFGELGIRLPELDASDDSPSSIPRTSTRELKRPGISPAGQTPSGRRIAVLTSDSSRKTSISFAASPRTDALEALDTPMKYVFDLHPVLHASQLQLAWADRHALNPLGGEHGFFTSGSRMHSPLVQVFEVLDVLPWDDRQVRKWLRHHDPGVVEVKCRLAKLDASGFQRRYSGNGSQALTLLVTRLSRRVRAIACRRLPTGESY